MSVQSVNYLIDSFGLNSCSVDPVLSIFENHGISLSEKDECTNLLKFINKIISIAEQNGEDSVSACMSILKAIVSNIPVSELEGCVVRILDFSKSVVFCFPNWNSKATGLFVMEYIFRNLKSLTNQFVREYLPRFKEFVYFHLDLFKREEFVPLFPSILSSLASLIQSLNTSVKPIINNIEPIIYSLLDNPNEAIRKKAVLVLVSLTSADKTDEMWKDLLNKTLLSIQITINEITGVSDSILLSRPHLSFPSLASLGRITPVFAQARFSTLLSIVHTLFQKIPPTCGIPIFSLISTLLSLLALFVPKGRRNDEASIDGIALSPKEQWFIIPLLFPQVFEVLNYIICTVKGVILVTIQPLVSSLRLFFLRYYKEYDISLIIAVYSTLECLIKVAGPSVIPLCSELMKPTLSILRCMNTSQDKVTITAGEGKKQGKKNRTKRVVYQVNQDENAVSIAHEEYAWQKHPKVASLYCQAIQFITVMIQKGRFIPEKDRFDIDLQLFLCFSQVVLPTLPHHTPVLLHTNNVFRQSVTDAILACCFTCLPTGQLSPVVSLIQPILQQHSVYSLLSPAQVNSIQALYLMNHTPTQLNYRMNENEICVNVTSVVEEEVEEPVKRQSVKRASIPIITREVEEPSNLPVANVTTVPIQTGDSEQVKEDTVEMPAKQVHVDEEKPVNQMNNVESTMMRLRKLSQDFVEQERKKSIELEKIPTTPITNGDDDFVFSDDSEFDVPDIYNSLLETNKCIS